MPTTLTDARCRAAQPSEKLVKLFDGGGLHLAVTPHGAKTWRVAYRLAGTPKTISLGPYPSVGLAEARRKRDELKAVLRDGGDPMAGRKAARAGMTLAQASAEFWAGRGDLSPSYRSNAVRAIEMHALPKLGARPIGSITRDDIMAVLKPMDAAGLHDYVRKTRMWLGQVFDWAVERREADINPCALINPRKAFGHSPVQHFASVPMAEVPELVRRLAMERELQSVLACRLLALTWVRTTELRAMPWVEVDGAMWTIQGPRMKRRKDHLVPLSRQALVVLDALRQRRTGSDYVFPAEHRIDRPMSENTILALLARIGYKHRMTGHGWRTIASTWANDNGYRADAIERQLAHSPENKVRAAYNRAEFMPERAVMLQAWADWLDGAAAA
jgi:integrase